MALFLKKKRTVVSTPVVDPPTPQEFLEKRLRENDVNYSIKGDDSDTSLVAIYRGSTDLPCLRIETTQLFTNPNCAYTYSRKEWRQNMFAPHTLGYIDVNVTDAYEVCLSAMAPGDNIFDEDVLQHRMDKISALLAQDLGLFRKSTCLKDVKYPNARIGECPYIIFGGHNSGFTYAVKPGVQSTEFVFNMIQLFALVVHRTFGTVYKSYADLADAKMSSSAHYRPRADDDISGYGSVYREVTPQMRLM